MLLIVFLYICFRFHSQWVVLAALFFLNVKTLSNVHMAKIKKEVAALGVKFEKGQTHIK